MSITFYTKKSNFKHESELFLTRFCGPNNLVENEVSPLCLQISISGNKDTNYILLTYSEAELLRDQINRYLSLETEDTLKDIYSS